MRVSRSACVLPQFFLLKSKTKHDGKALLWEITYIVFHFSTCLWFKINWKCCVDRGIQCIPCIHEPATVYRTTVYWMTVHRNDNLSNGGLSNDTLSNFTTVYRTTVYGNDSLSNRQLRPIEFCYWHTQNLAKPLLLAFPLKINSISKLL